MFRNVLLVLLLLGSFSSFGQQDYYATDTLIHSGVKILDNGSLKNFRQFVVETDSGNVKLNPDVVKEFTLNGKVFLSRKITLGDTIKSVFIRREVEGKMNLYSYSGVEGKKFFISKDSLHLVELVKKDESGKNDLFRKVLKENATGCEYIGQAVKLTVFTKSSLTAFTKFYNDCRDKPFPFIKMGIIIGFENSSIIKNEDISESLLKNSSFKKDNHFLLGLFIDFPIQNQFSLHSEIFLQRNKFYWHEVSMNAVTDAMVSSQSLNIPLLLRYTLPGKVICPFFEAGPSVVYSLVDNSKIYMLAVKNNVIELDDLHARRYPIISGLQPGYTLGAGIQVKLNYRNSLFLGTRYNKYPGSNDSFGTSKIQLLTGYNF
jgi:hypothetical protein